MRFIADWRPLYAALELLDSLVLEGPMPDDIAARLDAWADNAAEPGVAVELLANGERYHATDAMLAIVVDLWLYRAIGYCRVTH